VQIFLGRGPAGHAEPEPIGPMILGRDSGKSAVTAWSRGVVTVNHTVRATSGKVRTQTRSSVA
jgi:hypothetical protein